MFGQQRITGRSVRTQDDYLRECDEHGFSNTADLARRRFEVKRELRRRGIEFNNEDALSYLQSLLEESHG